MTFVFVWTGWAPPGESVRPSIGRRYIAMGAAGWHICVDVLDHLLAGTPTGRIVGQEAMKFGWPRLNAEYSEQFGVEPFSWTKPS